MSSNEKGTGQPAPQSTKSGGTTITRRWLLGTAVIAIGALAYLGWQNFQPGKLPEGFASSNGRVEATEVDVAAKTGGRLVEVLVNEGDFVTNGQVLARMDTAVLSAQLREAEAELRRAKTAVETAQSTVKQRESEKAAAEAVVAQREAELDLANSKFTRSEKLAGSKTISKEEYDTAKATLFGAKAALSRAQADVAAGVAAISTANSQVISAEASVGAAQATIERIQADLDDSVLKSSCDGRVQYRIAQPGEVLAAGGKVLNLVDLTDVYMTFFLPTAEAGRIQVGSDVRLVLDASPHLVIPAKVTFVADVAQFTPKTVETAEERQKLMFRIKVHVAPELLREHIRSVKTGLPGMAYVRLDPAAQWPAHLEINLPDLPK